MSTTTAHHHGRTRTILLTATMTAVTVGLAQGAAQAAPVCSSANPFACFQFFTPSAPTTTAPPPPPPAPPAPAPAPLPVVPVVTNLVGTVFPTVTQEVPAAARLLLDLANGERAQAGLGRLTSRDDVTAIALEHSYRMAAAGNIFHNDNYFSTLVRTLVNSVARGENVAQNMSVEDAHRRLMNSPGHRANLLDPRFSVVGFAVVQSSSGQYWVTQDFLQPGPGSAAAAAARSAQPKAPAAARPVVKPAAAKSAPEPPAAAPAPPAPVSMDLASTTLTMVGPAPDPVLVAHGGATRANDPWAGGGVVLIVVVLAGGLGCWQLRRTRRPACGRRKGVAP